MRDKVIILHGIFNSRYMLIKGERFLKKSGFDVLNLDYPSITKSIEDIIDYIHVKIKEFNLDENGKLHFVGYSMGGLIIRAYVNKYKPINLARIIMIGTPNQGSEVADFLKDFWLYKLMFGPAGQQLITNQEKFLNILGEINAEIGLVIGNKPLFPIFGRLFKIPNDGLVSVKSVMIKGAKYIILPYAHVSLMFKDKVWEVVGNFLKNGEF